MCSAGLETKKDAAKWLIAHHPDKGGEPTSIDVGSVASCMGEKLFCSKPVSAATTAASAAGQETKRSTPAESELRSVDRVFERVKIKTAPRDVPSAQAPEVAYKPSDRQLQCVRQVGNWSKITPKNRFNKSRFSIAETDKLIPIASPKLEAMLQNIAALDAHDEMMFGKKFKHFIFSDIKFLGYGAKIVSAAMIARGFKPILKYDKNKIVVEVPKGGEGRNFAVLSSTALWDKPFKHTLKKEVLGVYNKRPDNVYGDDCRFIILDSGFKEGIDLFDVRYVHLYEPLMTQADMTQALGRATRLCGQKGLDFEPNKGWPLHVFKYSQSIPEQLQPFYKAKTLFDIALQLKGLDTRMHAVSKAINDVSILAAVDQPLTDEIHKSGMLPQMKVASKSASAARSNQQATQGSSELVTTRNTIDAQSEMSRANLVSSDKRVAYSQQLLLENAKTGADSLEGVAESEIPSDPCSAKVPDDCLSMSIVPFQPSRLSSATIQPTVVIESNVLVIRPPSGAAAEAASALKKNTLPKSWFGLRHYIAENFADYKWPPQVVENRCVAKGGGPKTTAKAKPVDKEKAKAAKVTAKAKQTAAAAKKAAARATAKAKATKAKEKERAAKEKEKAKAATAKAKAQAAPGAVPAAGEKEFKAPAKKGTLPTLSLVNYTPTQAFISNYFTAESPVRGMLMWHSVGTGKTCTAIALASTQFEKEGYTIMWVTRHTLKADIWKNIFDQVCHSTIANEVRRGELRPEDAERRQRALYANWIPPVSYRQFSNIVQGKNPIYKMLQARNGKADPLRKTLIIIDEAHKLYSADFKGAEKPDVPAFMAALQNSYSESGADSARVLLMTATPYNESPMELMMLLNLCRPKATWLPTEMPAFIAKYMDADGRFTKDGLRNYMDDIAGQISYLNREADPSQFAQPIFADVVVPISTFADVTEGDGDEVLELRKDLADLQVEKHELIENTIPYLEKEVGRIGPALDAQLAECEKSFAGRKKELKECTTRVTKRYREGLKLEERNLREARVRADKIDKEYAKLEKKIARTTVKMRKTGKSSLTQQAQLEVRCKVGLFNP
jgi:superfamily II DNA or RNA helicase